MTAADEAVNSLSRAMHELEAAVAEAAPLLSVRQADRGGRILLRAESWLRGQAHALLVRGTTLRAVGGRNDRHNHYLHTYDQEVRRACRELGQLAAGVHEAYTAAKQDIVREMDASRASFDAVAERAQHAWSEAEDLVAQLTEIYGDSTPPPQGLAAPLRELLLALQVQNKCPPSNVAAEFSGSERRVRTQFDPAALAASHAIIRRLREAVEPVERALSRLREAQDATLGDLTATGVLDDKEKAEREFEHAASIAAGTARLVADAAATLEDHFERLRAINVSADKVEPLARALHDAEWHDIVFQATEWAGRCSKILAFRQPRCAGGALTQESLRTLVSTVLSWLGLATAVDGVRAAHALRSAADDFEKRALRSIVVATRVSVRAARLAASSRPASPKSLGTPQSVRSPELGSSSVRELEPRTAGDVTTLAARLMDEQAALEATLRIMADRLSLAREELSMPHECSLTRAAELAIETRLADSHLVDLSVKITGLVKHLAPTAPLRDPQAAKDWLTRLRNALQHHGARCISITGEIQDALAVISEDVAHGAGWQAGDWDLVCSAPRHARALLLARQRLQQRRNDNAFAAANACRESQATLAAWLDQCGLAFPRELRDLDAQLRVTMSGAHHPARRVAAVQATLDAALGKAEAASCKQLSVAWASVERKAWQGAAAVARSRRKRKLSTICEARAASVLAVEMTRRRDIQKLAETRSIDEICERPWSCVPTARPMIEATFATSGTDHDDMLSLVIDDDALGVLERARSVVPGDTQAPDSASSIAPRSEQIDSARSGEAAANVIDQGESEPEPSAV